MIGDALNRLARRSLTPLIFNVLWLASAPLFAQTAQVILARQEVLAENKAVFHFNLPENSQFEIHPLHNPQRLVIDVTGAGIGEDLPQSLPAHPFVTAVRAANYSGNKARLVIELKDDVVIDSFNSQTEVSVGQQTLTVFLTVKTPAKSPIFVANTRKPTQGANDDEAEEAIPELLTDWDISGAIGVENLAFIHEGLAPEQHNNYVSGVFQAEFYKTWDDGRQSFAFVPFYRYSQHDNRRTHFDIRELTWLMAERDWELRTGFRKIFWGVAEGLHLIDIINQTDLVENPDTEDKLGQPMVNLALINDWGTIDLFVMPGFRERTFSGVEGRFRLIPEIAVGDAIFDRSGLEKHMSYAVRWAHYFGAWDIGISHFYGMGREPRFIPTFDRNGQISKIVPLYETINQTSLDLQMTHESWLWKLEAMVRSGMGKTFSPPSGASNIPCSMCMKAAWI
nr:AMIN domain-containing protein [Methylomarinum sp. Ch1-1]MDP4520434.1 AMIN domain-containing protein [Methylomarinum sp. Ch1-1]